MPSREFTILQRGEALSKREGPRIEKSSLELLESWKVPGIYEFDLFKPINVTEPHNIDVWGGSRTVVWESRRAKTNNP